MKIDDEFTVGLPSTEHLKLLKFKVVEMQISKETGECLVFFNSQESLGWADIPKALKIVKEAMYYYEKYNGKIIDLDEIRKIEEAGSIVNINEKVIDDDEV